MTVTSKTRDRRREEKGDRKNIGSAAEMKKKSQKNSTKRSIIAFISTSIVSKLEEIWLQKIDLDVCEHIQKF